jgi:glucosylceramidase
MGNRKSMMKIGLNSALAALMVTGLSLAGCTSLQAPSTGGEALVRGAPVHSWVTLTDQSKLLFQEADTFFDPKASLPLNIEVDASKRYQEMVGFGANITDASAWLIQHRLNDQQRKALMADLFGKSPGVGFSFTRLTIGASDFSRSHYSLDDVPAGQTDYPLSHFSIAPMRADVLPVVKNALAINPQLRVMASPWSAPAWMKTNDSLIQGALRPDAYGAFARYLGKFADAMEAEGVPLYAITTQNEPNFEPKDYPGMRVDSAARAKLIGEHLGPLFAQRSKPVRILDWDHNWDEPQAPLAVLADDKARPFVAGVAWHCYSGDVAVQSTVHDAYPDKETYFTECSGGEWKPHWRETLPWYMRNLILGTTRGWAKGVLMWNIALDENHGPHLGGCGDCRGVVTINSKTGEVTRNFDYYALAHASRFVRPGAHRIASTAGVDGLESVAFQNADDHSVVLIVLNAANVSRRFSVSQGGQTFAYTMADASVATFVWNVKH